MSIFNTLLLVSFLSFSAPETDNTISWTTFEEAIEKNKTDQRYIFIDLYTSWCGWCKKMDASTFKNKDVVAYMNANFHSVKFNAEQAGDVQYKEHTFKLISQGNRKIHQLAYSLLDGNMSYPSFVILDKEEKRVTILKGYMDANAFLTKVKNVIQ